MTGRAEVTFPPISLSRNGEKRHMPMSFSDDEMTAIMQLAEPVPVEHRDAFLQSLADALAVYPETGVGVVHREAARLQRDFLRAPAPSRANKYYR